MNLRDNRRSVWEREGKRQRETERAILCLILEYISHPPYSNQISQLRPKTSAMMDDRAAGIVGYFYLPHSSDFSASWQVSAQALFSFTWLYPHLRLQSTWFPLCYWTQRKKCECFSECDLAEGGPLHMLRAPGHFDQHVARHKSFSIIDIVQVVSIRLWGGGLVANEALKEFPPPVGISYLILERGALFFGPPKYLIHWESHYAVLLYGKKQLEHYSKHLFLCFTEVSQ